MNGFHILPLRHGVGDDPGPGLEISDPIAHFHGADGDAGIEIAGKIQVAEGTGIEPAAFRLQLFNNFHRPHLGCAGDGAGGKASFQGINRVELRAELPFHFRDDVHHMAVALNLHLLTHLHRTVGGDTPYIIAPEIDQHHVLGALFLILKQIGGQALILLSGGAARAGAGNRPHRDVAIFHPHQELRTGADNLLAAKA